jgi:sigma-70-like protein
MEMPFLTRKSFEAQLERAVKKYEQRIAVILKQKPYHSSGKVGRIFKLINKIRSLPKGTLFSYRSPELLEIVPNASIRPDVYTYWCLCSSLGYLERCGLIRKVRMEPSNYKGLSHPLYKLCEPPQGPAKIKIKRAIKRLLEQSMELESRFYVRTACLASLANVGTVNVERDNEIIDQRIAGDTLQEIGDRYNITRERVRQIIEVAVTNKEYF